MSSPAPADGLTYKSTPTRTPPQIQQKASNLLDGWTFGCVPIGADLDPKAFDANLNAVVMELQRTPGANVKLTSEIEGEAENGFDDAEIGVVRDNARQLKFKTKSTDFGE